MNEVCQFQQNTNHSHGLESEELNLVLKNLKAHNIIFSKNNIFHGEKAEYYGLTSMGGVWESERCPIWHLYIEDSIEPVNTEGKWLARLRSFSESNLIITTKYYGETALLGILVSEPKYIELHSDDLIYCKQEENAFESIVIVQESGEPTAAQW